MRLARDFQSKLHEHTYLIGKTVLDLHEMAEGNLLVLGIQRTDGNVVRSNLLQERDAVIVVARSGGLPFKLRAETEREELA